MEIFQPCLQLVSEPDGEYTLHAVTIAPHHGYSAGRARPGVPPSVRIAPEVFPVLLAIRVRRGPALQVLTPIRHHLRSLRLGPPHGKTSVLAFAMVGDQVVGSASIQVCPVHAGPKNPVTVDTSDWYAWQNRMPPGPASFHITGQVLLPTPGYDAELVPASPQGINPRELILDLKVTPRAGLWPQIVTPVSVRYDRSAGSATEQSPAGISYDGVLVREPDGDAVHLEVEIVQ